MVSKWYRGHNGKQKATDNFGIIWLADNPEYAQLYADEYGNEGVVSVFYIDENKLNCADTYYNDNFDVYDPDMREVKEYQKEGYNCYTFPVDMGDTDVLALFDESAIIKIEQMNKSKNIMENKIKLTETELKKIIAESVKKVLKESYSHDTESKTYRAIDANGCVVTFTLDWNDMEGIWTMDAFDEENFEPIDNGFTCHSLSEEEAVRKAKAYIKRHEMCY